LESVLFVVRLSCLLIAGCLLAIGFAEPGAIKALIHRLVSQDADPFRIGNFVGGLQLMGRLGAVVFLLVALGAPAVPGLLQMQIGWLRAACSEFRLELKQLFVLCRAEKKLVLLGGLLTLGGIIFRLVYLGRDVRYDEAFSYIEFASRPFLKAISHYPELNNQILHTIGVWFVTRCFGIAPEVLRLPALVAGVLLIPACGLAAGAFYGRRVFVPAVALMAFLPCWVNFSVNARGYTLQGLFLALGLVSAAFLIRKPELKWPWLGFVICASLATYTVPTSILIFSSLGVWLLCQDVSRWRHWLVASLVAGLMVLLLYSPVFLYSGWSAVFGNKYVMPISTTEYWANAPGMVQKVLKLIVLGFDGKVSVIVAVILVGSFFVPIAKGMGRTRVPLAFFMVLSAVGYSLTRQALGYPRIWLYLTIPMILVLAWGVAEMAETFPVLRRRTLLLFVVCFPIVAVASSIRSSALIEETSGYRNPHVIEAAHLLNQLAKPGQSRITAHILSDHMLTYYLRLLHPKTEACWHDNRPGTPIFLYVEVPESGTEKELFAALDKAKKNQYRPAILEIRHRRNEEFHLIRRWPMAALLRIDPLP
jgi:hypothetical protein